MLAHVLLRVISVPRALRCASLPTALTRHWNLTLALGLTLVAQASVFVPTGLMAKVNLMFACKFRYGLPAWALHRMEALRKCVQDNHLTRGMSALPMASLLAPVSAWHHLITNVMATIAQRELNAWVTRALEWQR